MAFIKVQISVIHSIDPNKFFVSSSAFHLKYFNSVFLDKTLKVWRVFPFAEEALTPLLLFINSNVVYLLSFCNHVLSAVFQDNERATYTLAVYKTKDNKNGRFDLNSNIYNCYPQLSVIMEHA